MTTTTDKITSIQQQPFELTVKNGAISSLKINGINVSVNKLITDEFKKLNDSLKYSNYTITANNSNYQFKNDKGLGLFSQKSDICNEDVLGPIQKIHNFAHQSQIVQAVKTHEIKQLDKKSPVNKTVSTLLVFVFAFGILAGVIGVGMLLPHLHLPTLPFIGNLSKEGINGIPMSAVVPLLGTGAASILMLIGLRIKAKTYFDAIIARRSEMFFDSNANDLLGAAFYVLTALILLNPNSLFFHSTGISILSGCLAYPAGFLFVTSASYQIVESIKAIKNALQIGDKKEALKSMLNLIGAVSIGIVGVYMIVGNLNGKLPVLFNVIVGSMCVLVAGWGFGGTAKKLKTLWNVDSNNAESIVKYLQEKLYLNDEEIKEIETKINAYKQNEIKKWLNDNYENLAKGSCLKYLKDDLDQNTDRILLDMGIEKAKKEIINEEIKKAIERKTADLSSCIKAETLKEVLNSFNDYLNKKDISTEESNKIEESLKTAFGKVKKEIIYKTVAELVKFFILYIPLMIIPGLTKAKVLSSQVFDILMAVLLGISFGINITSKFRNVQPTNRKEPLDINNALNKSSDEQSNKSNQKQESKEPLGAIA